MKLISLNIECNKHYLRNIPFLLKENPDVICLQEVLEEDFEYLQKELGQNGIYKSWKYFDSRQDHHKDMYAKRFGNAIFSRSIIASGHYYYWGKEEYSIVPFDEYVKRQEELKNYVLLWADIRDKDGEVHRIVTTHFPATVRGESTPHQLELMVPFFEKLDSLGEFVLCGDFNAPRGNETFSRLAKKYSDAVPSHYKTSIDNSLHRNGYENIIFMVDGLFLTEAYEAHDVVLIDGVSDHMAIRATITKKQNEM